MTILTARDPARQTPAELAPDHISGDLLALAERCQREHGGTVSSFLAGAYASAYRRLWDLYQAELSRDVSDNDFFPTPLA